METHHFKILEGTLSISPKKFNATMELQSTITNTEKLEDFSASKDLFQFPVPELGYEIPEICTIGLVLSSKVGYEVKALASATFKIGATASLPDDAVIHIDLLSPDKFTHDGFSRNAIEPIFDVTGFSGSVKAAVFLKAIMEYEIELHGFKKLAVALELKIPQFSATLNAGYSKNFSSPFLKSQLILNLYSYRGRWLL